MVLFTEHVSSFARLSCMRFCRIQLFTGWRRRRHRTSALIENPFCLSQLISQTLHDDLTSRSRYRICKYYICVKKLSYERSFVCDIPIRTILGLCTVVTHELQGWKLRCNGTVLMLLCSKHLFLTLILATFYIFLGMQFYK